MENKFYETIVNKIESKIKSEEELAKYYTNKLHTDNINDICNTLCNNALVLFTINAKIIFLKDTLDEVNYEYKHNSNIDIVDFVKKLYDDYVFNLINTKFIETSNCIYNLQKQCEEEALKKHIQFLNTMIKNI